MAERYDDIQHWLIDLAAADALEPRDHVRAPSAGAAEAKIVSLAEWRLRSA